MSNEKPLLVERHGPVGVLTLDRPKAHNALSRTLISALVQALNEMEDDGRIRVVVIAGSERTFCAGADIDEITTMMGVPVLDPLPIDPLFELLGRYRKPTVAAVRGLALGGGCEIALACDIAIAGQSARFGVPEVALGVLPGAGGTQRLVHALGKAKAMKMLLTGDHVDADYAYAAGLVAEVVSDTDVLDHATALANRIASNGPLAVQLAMNSARNAFEATLAQGLTVERRNFHILLSSEDAQEGVDAFLAKRPPQFTGQ
jgi:enoyl-CoA hydratase